MNEEGSGSGRCGLRAHFGADVEGEGGEQVGAGDEIELESVEFLGLGLEGRLFADLESEQVRSAQLEAVLFDLLKGAGQVDIEGGSADLLVSGDEGFVRVANLGEDAVAGEDGLAVDLIDPALGFLDGAAGLAALKGHAELQTEFEFEFVAVGVGVVTERLDDFGAGVETGKHSVASEALIDLETATREFELANLGPAQECGLELLGIRFRVGNWGGRGLVGEPGSGDDDRSVAAVTVEEGKGEAGGLETSACADDAQFAADDQLLVFLADDGGGKAAFDLSGDGVLTVLSDA